jgi:hypothetical protein
MIYQLLENYAATFQYGLAAIDANISKRKFNYGGLNDITEWFMQKDLNEH